MTSISSATAMSHRLEQVHHYYCSPRITGERKVSVYEIWEEGGAFSDSVTPSTYCPEYRSHIELKILAITEPNDQVFSIGCGNGFVEAGLVQKSRKVVAIDCNEEAVTLSNAKGVDAYRADFFALPKDHLAGFDVIYADGLLGHVYHQDTGLDRFFGKLAGLSLKPGAWLVFSNDAPRERGVDVAPHDRLDNFWFLSKEYLVRTLNKWELETHETYSFPYIRPISGMRDRAICVGRVPPAEPTDR